MPHNSRLRSAAVVLIGCFFATALTGQRTVKRFDEDWSPLLSEPQENPAPESWQLRLAVSNSIGAGAYNGYYRRLRLFETPNRGSTFVLPDGRTLTGTTAESGYGRFHRTNFTLFRAGLMRQTASGLVFHLTGGYYTGFTRPSNDILDGLSDRDLVQYERIQERSVSLEAGMHYLFLKRRRVRPYVGINLISYLYYRGEQREEFIVGGSGETGLVRGFRSVEHFPLYPEFAVTAGVQVSVTPRLSLNAFAHANWANNILFDTPLGLEARYALSWGKHRFWKPR